RERDHRRGFRFWPIGRKVLDEPLPRPGGSRLGGYPNRGGDLPALPTPVPFTACVYRIAKNLMVSSPAHSESRQPLPAGLDSVMPWPEGLLEDPQRLREKPLRLLPPPAVALDHGQVVEARGHIGVLLPHRLQADLEGAPEEGSGRIELAPGLLDHGQVVEGHAHVGVKGPEGGLEDGDRPPVEGLRLSYFL